MRVWDVPGGVGQRGWVGLVGWASGVSLRVCGGWKWGLWCGWSSQRGQWRGSSSVGEAHSHEWWLVWEQWVV